MTRVAAHYREAVDGCPEAAIHPDARRGQCVAGVVLLGAFLLGAVTAAAVLRYGYQARWLSLVTSAVFVLGGAAVAVLLSADGTPAASDLLLLGGTPVACGVATGLLALGRVTAARRR